MEIKVGDRCKLRNGFIATITSIDNSLTLDYPIRGQTPFSHHIWTIKGFYWQDELRSDYDIVEIMEVGKMNFEVGKLYKLRCGAIVRVTEISDCVSDETYPVKCYVIDTCGDGHMKVGDDDYWTLQGLYVDDDPDNVLDIVGPAEVPQETVVDNKPKADDALVTPLDIQVGRFYKTRDGRKARIYALDGNRPYSVHGALLSDDDWNAHIWRIDGSFGEVMKKHDHDIISEWAEKLVVDWNALPPGILSVAIDGDNEACGCLYPKMDLYGKHWAGPVNNNISSINVIPIKREIITFTGDWKHSLAIRPGYEKSKE